MILIINTCKEKLHYYEFVKPIENIVEKGFFTKHYSEIIGKDLDKADKIIICGTSLKDNQFMKDIKKFKWMRDFGKPILGICAGMQVIGAIFGGDVKRKTEIGFFKEKFDKEFLGLSGNQEVYHLHNNYISKWKGFDIFCSGNGVVQAVKHKEKNIFGVLFHPEVRQKDLIRKFV
jgi:GMP synthase (glutamine-hydrolysing)